MFYLFQPLNHLTNIKNWAKKHGVHLHISPDTFALTITRSGRIVRLQPRFVTKESGKIGYKREYENIGAFVGWVLPNTPTWPAASDKIFFKQQANALKLRIPAAWNNGEFLSEDYLIKIRNGSFGRDIQGPFKASRLHKPLSSTSEYYEQFIPGRSVAR
ncbi:hypothetical protein [Herbaspirillum lusitanum]|uniref:hypothetical protein n=1 Tax=Herbaspirillum lusitanum TaxID=213312 RepID=UPI002238D955|nr:hypothetical protein [Herbaspirillum lusitanum]